MPSGSLKTNYRVRDRVGGVDNARVLDAKAVEPTSPGLQVGVRGNAEGNMVQAWMSATRRFMKLDTVSPASWSTTEISGLSGVRARPDSSGPMSWRA